MIGKNRGEAVVSWGASLEVRDPDTLEWLDIIGLASFNGPNVTRAEIEVTRLDSMAKEYVMDLKDNGAFTATAFTLLGDRSQQILARNLDSPNALDFRLHLPDDGFDNGEVICGFRARVSGFPISGAKSQVITTELSLRITGDLEWTFPDSNAPRLTWSTHILDEDSANDGRVAGIISVIVHGGTFDGPDNEPLAGVTFSGVPDGLTAECVKVSDNTVYIGFTGTALAHDEDDSGAVTVTFGNAAFASGSAAAIANTKNQVIIINFLD